MKTNRYEKEKLRVNKSWNAFFDMVAKREEAHDNFMKHRIVPPVSVIAEDIADSWSQSLEMGLDPDHIEPKYMEGAPFERLLEESKNLLSAADLVLEEFALQFSTSLFTVDLYDKNLVLLRRYGQKEEGCVGRSGIKPGLIKSEQCCGITSMSCVIRRNSAVQLVGGEHFSSDLMEHVCTAAPIYFEGDLAGIINVIEFQWEKDNRTLGTIVGLAKLIENSYNQLKLRREIDSEAAVNEEIINVTPEGILLISAAGNVVKASPRACSLLGMAQDNLEGHNIQQLFDHENLIQTAISKKMNVSDQEIKLNLGGVTKRFMGNIKIIQTDRELFKVMVSLKDMQSVRNIIRNVGGWDAKYTFKDIVGSSPIFRQAVDFARETAVLVSNTLIEGESGTGKELFAQAIHNASTFAAGPFVSVNCGTIPASLLESELFGYESGSFTGAKKGGQIGKFELAEGGTIFLDEINSLPLDMQVKLLRVLQEKKICRIGGNNNVQLHIKIIAASNENLWELVQRGKFRADLFYRLNVITIHIPPLYQHPDDIPEISQAIMTRIATGETPYTISKEAENMLLHYRWPGNVRELENTIERAIVNARLRGDRCICLSDIEGTIGPTVGSDGLGTVLAEAEEREVELRDDKDHRLTGQSGAHENWEKEEIVECLRENGGNISATARKLGISRNTLYQRLYKYDIRIKNF